MQLAEFPFNEDMNSGDPIGIGAFCLTRVHSTNANQALPGWAQLSIGGGKRSSASVSYLTPALSRSNLDILVNTLVTRVVQTGTQPKSGRPIFRGVLFAQSDSGRDSETSRCSYTFQ
jgi:choline dehydrogenase-like flavoprotein